MSQKNFIWQFFEKCPSDASKAICKECNKLFSLGSSEPKRQKIHGLKLHLSKFHETEHRQYLKRQSEIKEHALENKLRRSDSVNSVFSTNSDSGSKLVQTTIPNIVQAQASKTSKWPDHHDISRRIDKAIMDLIIVDMLPYTLVESEAFRRLNFTDPHGLQKYNFKSEKYFRTSLMPQTYEKVSKKVQDLIDQCDWISGTCDIWTNPPKTCSLLSLTGHFIVGPKRLKVILGAQVLENDHTGLYIEEKLREMINEWKINDKLFLLLRDNARNMVSAMRGQYESLGCMSHTLQLVVKDALFSDEEHERVIKTCRQIVGHFKRSEQASRKLNECQKQCGLPIHSMIQDIEVRWNSTYNMLERLLEQKTAINLYSLEHGRIENLSTSDWELIKNLTDVLKFFYEATLDLSFDSACISVVIPLISLLNRKLQTRSENESEDMRNMKTRLHESMNQRFAYIKGHPALITSTLLDPRFKNLYLNSDEVDIATKEIKNHLKMYTDDISETISEDPQPSCSSSIASSEKGEGLWDAHDKSSCRSLETSEMDDGDRLSNVKRLMQAYLSEPRLQRNADIYSYRNSSPFVSLRKAALKFLSAPPTSVSSEQLFSAAGQIYSDRRSNLRGENVDKLLFLTYNIRLFNYEY
ncbi:zinc finger BED domain-containing protein 4-like [Coccinella septempunctata]|uniref:zinc finger BED domain-containing protein 4-like n=1 Tax=Coccinella septempunctata TaxID=41139 RepID=UPI001D06B2D6|nr:zinc finger BED domain-containing protein 4-like [Coccinella septempunctata]